MHSFISYSPVSNSLYWEDRSYKRKIDFLDLATVQVLDGRVCVYFSVVNGVLRLHIPTGVNRTRLYARHFAGPVVANISVHSFDSASFVGVETVILINEISELHFRVSGDYKLTGGMTAILKNSDWIRFDRFPEWSVLTGSQITLSSEFHQITGSNYAYNPV